MFRRNMHCDLLEPITAQVKELVLTHVPAQHALRRCKSVMRAGFGNQVLTHVPAQHALRQFKDQPLPKFGRRF